MLQIEKSQEAIVANTRYARKASKMPQELPLKPLGMTWLWGGCDLCFDALSVLINESYFLVRYGCCVCESARLSRDCLVAGEVVTRGPFLLLDLPHTVALKRCDCV